MAFGIVGMAAVRELLKEVHMRKIIVTVAAVAIAVSAVGLPKSAEARNGGAIAAGVIGGLAAGAIIGGAARGGYYGGSGYGYYGGPTYGYSSGYYAAPVYGYSSRPAYYGYPAYSAGYYGGGDCYLRRRVVGYDYYGRPIVRARRVCY